jgi:hypothetical protein
MVFMPTSAVDRGFYELVSNLIEAEKAEQLHTRRGNRRRKYACIQLVAPYAQGQRPHQSAFRHVECRDLSACGFSYYATQPPESGQLIVALGPVPFVFLKAEVVRQSEVTQRGRGKFLLGCRFIERFEGATEDG